MDQLNAEVTSLTQKVATDEATEEQAHASHTKAEEEHQAATAQANIHQLELKKVQEEHKEAIAEQTKAAKQKKDLKQIALDHHADLKKKKTTYTGEYKKAADKDLAKHTEASKTEEKASATKTEVPAVKTSTESDASAEADAKAKDDLKAVENFSKSDAGEGKE